MAYRTNIAALDAIASSNVSSITWTGNPPVYSSGGIPDAVVVTLDASDAIGDLAVKVAGTTDIPLGVAYLDRPAVTAGQPIAVQYVGVARLKAHAAISVGDQVVVGAADGTISTATTGAATSQALVGRALQAAAEAGDYISVQLTIGGTTVVAS